MHAYRHLLFLEGPSPLKRRNEYCIENINIAEADELKTAVNTCLKQSMMQVKTVTQICIAFLKCNFGDALNK